MVSTVIVALPAVGQRVQRVSSEKVPHLTLLYLDDLENVMDAADVVTFVEHAAKHLGPFYLSVDYRGTLGEKNADVLFFKDDLWNIKELKTFRHHLLLNTKIREMYDRTDQFPGWKPHLTLGYPDSPAKEQDDEVDTIFGVDFDRIAVWFGDYEGPEIRLEAKDYAVQELVMSDTEKLGAEAAKDILVHYGVKGMRWGYTTKPDGTVVLNKTGEKRALRSAKDVTVKQRKAGTYVKTKGGQRQKATEDAVRAQAVRQKAKKSTTDSLTTPELRQAIERMRLEQEFQKLDRKVSRKGRSFVSRLIESPQAKKAVEDLALRSLKP